MNWKFGKNAWKNMKVEQFNICLDDPDIRLFGKPRCKWKVIKKDRKEQEETRFWWGKLRERDYLEDPGVNGSIILRWIFRKLVGEHGLD
jgi:hypothetical protein